MATRKSLFELKDLSPIEKIIEGTYTYLPRAAAAAAAGGPARREHICNTCNADFSTEVELRAHVKLPWHIFNVKQVAAGKGPLSEESFKKQGVSAEEEKKKKKKKKKDDEDDEDDDDEESQEEEDESDERFVGSPRIAITTTDSNLFLWKAAIVSPPYHRTLVGEEKYNALAEGIEHASVRTKWAVLMSSGGRFAGGIFFEGKAVVHKAFQRYTVRKKQGGSQSKKDGESGAGGPKSVGSSIRRHETVRFREMTEEILKEWSPLLKQCHIILLFAPATNRKLLIFEGGPLTKDDMRIRTVPFPCRRPTFLEAQRIYKQMITVEIQPRGPSADPTPTPTPPILSPQHSISLPGEEEADEEEEEEEKEDLIIKAVKENDLITLQSLVEEDYQRPLSSLGVSAVAIAVSLKRSVEMITLLVECGEGVDDVDVEHNCQTALHIACSLNQGQLATTLLDLGADPTIRDSKGKLPAQLCHSKQTRQILMKYAGSKPDMWEWSKACIAMLSEEDEKKQKQQSSEKKKEKRKKAKEKQKQKKQEDQKKIQEEEAKAKAAAEEKKQKEKAKDMSVLTSEAKALREKMVSQMSDREKRALAAEHRHAASKGSGRLCDYCKKPVPAVPFYRLDFCYCTTGCLWNHKEALNDPRYA